MDKATKHYKILRKLNKEIKDQYKIIITELLNNPKIKLDALKYILPSKENILYSVIKVTDDKIIIKHDIYGKEEIDLEDIINIYPSVCDKYWTIILAKYI